MRYTALYYLMLLLCLLAFNLSPAHADSALNIERTTLDNGLRVVIVPTHDAPVISHHLIIHAGAADDPLGVSGVAHFLEHMLFKGTPANPEGEYSRKIEAIGGQYNAYTSADMTGYYVNAGKQHLETIMALESDRMINLQPSSNDYGTEREVVREERKLRVDANPGAQLSEAQRAALFRHHPYGTPIIGWDHEIQGLDEPSALAFFRRFYSPANVTLLIVGDVTASNVLNLAQQYYGAWNGAPKQPRNWTREPPRRSADVITLRHPDVTTPRWSRSYIAPSLGTAGNENEIMPLLFAEELLGNARTGVLYQTLVKEQQVATAVSVSYNPFTIGQSVLSVSLVPADGVSLAEISTAYEAVMRDFLASTPEARSMERTRNQLNAGTIYARDDIAGLTSILAQLIGIGLDADWFNRWNDYVAQVSAPQIISALSGVVNDDISVTAHLLPPKADTSQEDRQ